MDGRAVLRVFFVLIAVQALCIFCGPAASSPIDNMIPLPCCAEGWTLDGKIGQYTAGNLYEHINGEAELYLPYGFEALGTAFYSRGRNPGAGIAADIYRMGSALDAFGIYSNYRDGGVELVKIGAEGFINESQLMFFKDRYFVRLSISGTVEGGRSLLLQCAKSIAVKIPGADVRPEDLRMLDVQGVVPDTIRYVAQSVLGYRFFTRGLTADALVEGEQAKIFIVICESPEASSQALEDYIDYLRGSGLNPGRSGSMSEESFATEDPLYKRTVIRRYGKYLFGVAKMRDPSKATEMLNQVRSYIINP